MMGRMDLVGFVQIIVADGGVADKPIKTAN
jgi:hypothetical protein